MSQQPLRCHQSAHTHTHTFLKETNINGHQSKTNWSLMWKLKRFTTCWKQNGANIHKRRKANKPRQRNETSALTLKFLVLYFQWFSRVWCSLMSLFLAGKTTEPVGTLLAGLIILPEPEQLGQTWKGLRKKIICSEQLLTLFLCLFVFLVFVPTKMLVGQLSLLPLTGYGN